MAATKTHDTARGALTTLGVTGAALVLSTAAALPALACGHGDGGGSSHAHHQGAGQQGHSRYDDNQDDSSSAGHDSRGEDQGEESASGQESSGARAESRSEGHAYGRANKDKTHHDKASKETNTGAASGSSASGGESESGHNPPGNNGTVKIHDVAGDHSPHNVPHVGCTFYADFFGFDNGQQVTVSFAGQAPTGKGTPLGGSWTGTVSTDDAGGAGNDWDLELPFTADQLGVSSLGAPAHQGYHVKMTVLTNEPGGKKSKVFWIAPCTSTTPQPGGTDTGTDTDTGTGTGTGTDTDTATGSETGAGTESHSGTGQDSSGALNAMSEQQGSADIPTEVLGRSVTRGGAAPAPAAAPAASLPFTGAEIGALAGAAALALGGGTALTVLGRRRRAARQLTSS
jgi:hypothetical protein